MNNGNYHWDTFWKWNPHQTVPAYCCRIVYISDIIRRGVLSSKFFRLAITIKAQITRRDLKSSRRSPLIDSTWLRNLTSEGKWVNRRNRNDNKPLVRLQICSLLQQSFPNLSKVALVAVINIQWCSDCTVSACQKRSIKHIDPCSSGWTAMVVGGKCSFITASYVWKCVRIAFVHICWWTKTSWWLAVSALGVGGRLVQFGQWRWRMMKGIDLLWSVVSNITCTTRRAGQCVLV